MCGVVPTLVGVSAIGAIEGRDLADGVAVGGTIDDRGRAPTAEPSLLDADAGADGRAIADRAPVPIEVGLRAAVAGVEGASRRGVPIARLGLGMLLVLTAPLASTPLLLPLAGLLATARVLNGLS